MNEKLKKIFIGVSIISLSLNVAFVWAVITLSSNVSQSAILAKELQRKLDGVTKEITTSIVISGTIEQNNTDARGSITSGKDLADQIRAENNKLGSIIGASQAVISDLRTDNTGITTAIDKSWDFIGEAKRGNNTAQSIIRECINLLTESGTNQPGPTSLDSIGPSQDDGK